MDGLDVEAEILSRVICVLNSLGEQVTTGETCFFFAKSLEFPFRLRNCACTVMSRQQVRQAGGLRSLNPDQFIG